MSAFRFVVVAGLLASGSVLAAPRTAALVPNLKPSGAPELRDRFHEAVTRGLAQKGLDALPAAEVRSRLAASEELMACSAPGPCASRVALLLQRDRVVASEIGISGKDYTIKLRLLDGGGHEIARVDDSCDICTLREADEAVVRAASRLASMVPATPAPASPGAELPQAAPSAPPAAAPPAPVPPSAPSPQPTAPAKAELETPPMAAPATDAAVRPALAEAPASHGNAAALRIAAISTLVGGVVAIAIGIPLLVIDGGYTNCTGSPVTDPVHQCAQLWQTAGAGGTLVAIGAAAFVASGVLFYFDYRARHKKPGGIQGLLAPTANGGMLSVGGRF